MTAVIRRNDTFGVPRTSTCVRHLRFRDGRGLHPRGIEAGRLHCRSGPRDHLRRVRRRGGRRRRRCPVGPARGGDHGSRNRSRWSGRRDRAARFDERSRLARVEDRATVVLDPLHIELWPADDAADVILVDAPVSRRVGDSRSNGTGWRTDWSSASPTIVSPRRCPDRCSTAERCPRRTAVPALVVGPSGTGKSTLIADLVHAGLNCSTTSRSACTSRRGCSAGSRDPSTSRREASPTCPRWMGRSPPVTAEERSHRTPARPRHRLTGGPALLVQPERVDESDECESERLHPAEALDVLCANNLDLARDPLVASRRSPGWRRPCRCGWCATLMPRPAQRPSSIASGVRADCGRPVGGHRHDCRNGGGEVGEGRSASTVATGRDRAHRRSDRPVRRGDPRCRPSQPGRKRNVASNADRRVARRRPDQHLVAELERSGSWRHRPATARPSGPGVALPTHGGALALDRGLAHRVDHLVDRLAGHLDQ